MTDSLHRRRILSIMGAGAAALAWRPALAVVSMQAHTPQDAFTGPGANPYWNSVGPYVTYPQKLPLQRLTDRPIQLETPRQYFRETFTPNAAFFVRYHLPVTPNEVDLATWRLSLSGAFAHPVEFSMDQLLREFKPVSVAAVNQCSGNSRSRFEPRVPGGQWGNGAMGNAMWTGVRLRDLLARAGLQRDATWIQFEGLDRGVGADDKASGRFMKSLPANDPSLDRAVIAFLMNGEPLPMLNGFPVRMVVPGKFATYWTKHLSFIRALTHEDQNFWMNPAYRIPDTPGGDTTPQAMASGKVKSVPIGTVDMPVRSFIVDPDGSAPLIQGMSSLVRGVAFSGHGTVVKVEVSTDGGSTWSRARLGKDHGPYSFRTYTHAWIPHAAGRFTLAVRATDKAGNVQTDRGVWNPGGYLWNRIERQDVTVLSA